MLSAAFGAHSHIPEKMSLAVFDRLHLSDPSETFACVHPAMSALERERPEHNDTHRNTDAAC